MKNRLYHDLRLFDNIENNIRKATYQSPAYVFVDMFMEIGITLNRTKCFVDARQKIRTQSGQTIVIP